MCKVPTIQILFHAMYNPLNALPTRISHQSWQTRYHDRVFRDYDEFRGIAGYIEQNPENWNVDELNI